MSSEDTPQLELRVLGAVQLLRDGSPVALGGPKPRGVLAMLVLGEGAPVSVSRLIDGIWESQPPTGARGVIHTYVAQLRRSLGPEWRAALTTIGDGYSLQLPTGTTDLERFRHRTAHARRALRDGDPRAARQSLTEAISEFRGEPLSDVADLPFAGPAQLRLTELSMNAHEQALEIDLSLGDTGEAIAELGRLVAEHSYRERLWELLALAHYQDGRQVEALDAIQHARRLLREEMGIVPNPRLAQIELAILRQEPTDTFLQVQPLRWQLDAVESVTDRPSATVRSERPSAQPRPGRRHPGPLAAVVGALALIVVVVALMLRDGGGARPTAGPGDIGIVDAESGALLASVELGGSIAGIVANDEHVFATDPSGGVLVQIDPLRRTVTRSFALDGEPWRPTTTRHGVFVPIDAGQVARLDPAVGLVAQPLEPLGSNPGRVVVLDVGDRSWAVGTNGDLGALDDRRVAASTHTLPVGLQRVASDDTRIWAITDERQVELVSVTPPNIRTRARLRGVGADITVGLDALWVVTAEDNRLWRADRNTGEVLSTLALPSTPTGVVTTDNTVWVSTADGQLLGVDAIGERITKTIDFDQPIVSIAYGHSTLWIGFS